MLYEKPEILTVLPAVSVVQSAKANSGAEPPPPDKDASAAYEDWED